MSTANDSRSIEAPSDLVGNEDASFWLQEIEAGKDRLKDWYERAKEAEERYRDDKDRSFGSFNILWANVDVQKSALGDDFGKPEVTRTNAPENDGGLARFVSLILERTIDASVHDTQDNREIRNAAHDVLLPGRGQVWLELNPREDGNSVSYETTRGQSPDASKMLNWVEAPLVKVQYRYYLEGVANRWAEVPWVARGHLFTKDDLKRLAPDNFDKIPLNHELECPDDYKADVKKKDQFKRAMVWEIWSKYPEKRRLYVAEGYDKIIKVDADPYKLKHFFPCPRPLLANGDESWQLPITDFSRYQDQAEELDRVCQRIFVLLDALRRRGVFDKRYKELADLAEADDNVLIGIENFDSLTMSGTKPLPVLWEDMSPTVVALQQLYQQRQSLRDLIYELTGISDLVRGMTNAHETAAAQKMKIAYGSGRFQERQKESRRFAADAYSLKGELISEHFPRQQIEEMSGLNVPLETVRQQARTQLQAIQAYQKQGQTMPPIPPKALQQLQKAAIAPFSWEELSEVLRSDSRRCYTVSIATDQTQFMDEEADKASRIEFFSTFNQALQTFGPMIQASPEQGPIFKEMMMFVLSSFKGGRSLEQGIEGAIDSAIQRAQQAQQQGPQKDPKAEADMQVAQAKVQTAQIALQREQLGMQRDQLELQALQQKYGIEGQAKAQDTQLKAVEGQQKIQTQTMANEAKRTGHQVDIQNKVEQLQFERATRATAQEAILSGPTQLA